MDAEFDAHIEADKGFKPEIANPITAVKNQPVNNFEPSDQLVIGGVSHLQDPEASKKNKFLNVHQSDEYDDDFNFGSNAISDQVGDELPKVNLEGSQVSNRNFDEKMIETVNSEQLDSKQIVGAQKTPKKDDM